MSIKLDVSLGEALDKLSILEIKCDKISDERNKDVKIEYDYLKTELSKYLDTHSYLYKILKKVNLNIWEFQDIIRSENFCKDNFYIVCDEILNLNDSRYLIKKKINETSNSKLKEQKGYSLRNLNIFINTSDENLYYLNSVVRYFSFYYDNVYVYCEDLIYDKTKNIFSDDVFIVVYKVSEYVENNHDYIKINNEQIFKNIKHSYFVNKKTIINQNEKYPLEINKLFTELNIDIKIIEEYSN